MHETNINMQFPSDLMAKLLKFICDNCEHELKTWENGVIYVTNDDNERILCRHPGESYQVAKVLGISEMDIFGFPYMRIPKPSLYPLLNERVGVVTDCLCNDCSNEFKIDWRTDERVCPKCKSDDIIPVDNLDGLPCSKCKEGKFRYQYTGIIS